MKTLIELFDDSPILNVLASAAFKPEKLVFFGADEDEVIESRNDYTRFFKSRGENIKIEYVSADMDDINSVNSTLADIIHNNPDCVVDVTGGDDIALLAAGMAAVRLQTPLIAYNRKTKKYANINGFPHAMEADIFGLLDCEDFFNASGGSLIDSEDFSDRKHDFELFWRKVLKIWSIYLEHLDSWTAHVQYLQKVSPPADPTGKFQLHIKAPKSVKVNGKALNRNDEILRELNFCGGITGFRVHENDEAEFMYCDTDFRRYLTDVGAFLELFMHACAMNTKRFSSVRSRVKYNWEYSKIRHDHSTIFRPASNEIDVIAINGIEPLFISCKTCAPDMKYIDEIYPQAMRMSGGEGHAVFACTHPIDIDMPVYNKAKALGVYIIDGDDIKNNLVTERLMQIAEDRYIWKDEPEYQTLIKK